MSQSCDDIAGVLRLLKENEELVKKLEAAEKENQQSKQELGVSVARITELEALLKEAENDKNKQAGIAAVPIIGAERRGGGGILKIQLSRSETLILTLVTFL